MIIDAFDELDSVNQKSLLEELEEHFSTCKKRVLLSRKIPESITHHFSNWRIFRILGKDCAVKTQETILNSHYGHTVKVRPHFDGFYMSGFSFSQRAVASQVEN